MSNRLTISLGALSANFDRFRNCARGDVAAVVKANGYGVGALQVAEHLAAAGCEDFFVGTAAEGESLAPSLPGARIYVLEGVLPQTADTLAADGLIPVLNTPQQAATWAPRKLPAALHLDTGMRRLGMTAEQAADVFAAQALDVNLVMTHLARADEPGDAFNSIQLQRFSQTYAHLYGRYPQQVPLRVSVGNSAAMLAGLENDLHGLSDEVRLLGRAGVGLYGGAALTGAANPMQPVVGLQARVLQLLPLDAGVPVGYGGTYTSSQARLLATVAAGYADGIPRLLSNSGRVWVNNTYCPIVGRVSMDLVHVDVTGVAGVEEGTWVEILGTHISVDEIAAHAGTIGYEVLTGLGRRGECVYTNSFL